MRAGSRSTQGLSGTFSKQWGTTSRDSRNPCWLSIYMKSSSTFWVSGAGCGSSSDSPRVFPLGFEIVLLANRFPLRLRRPAPGAGRGHWGSSSQLPLAAAAQQATTSAPAAPDGPSLPEPPPSSAQRLHRNPHTGTVAWTPCTSSLVLLSGPCS